MAHNFAFYFLDSQHFCFPHSVIITPQTALIKELTHLSLGSDDPNGIQLSAPLAANGFAKTTNKVLTPEMVNLGIKVAALFLSIAPSVSLPSNSPVKVMSYAVRGPLAIRAVELEKEIKAVKTKKLPSCKYIYVQYPSITNI